MTPSLGMLLVAMSDDDLVKGVAYVRQRMAELEAEAFSRLTDRGATELQGSTHVLILERSIRYDRDRLAPLLEILPHEELERCYSPAREETVTLPCRWDMTRTKATARKIGRAALEIIEAASSPGPGRLKLEERRK